MIPKKLELQGLYSYQEKQVIDFEKLTKAGLFGIFGAVGSGKSSILEAILLALYGSTERLSSTGERSSMVNLQSDRLLVNFEFLSGHGNQNRYLARYSAKRNKKDKSKIDTGEHILYERSGSEWKATDKSAEEILGMKKEHFKQTVIIPQGKFREFIDLKPRDQASMMKELFGLQRFDLSIPTKVLKKEVEEKLIRTRTKLEGLEEVSGEILGNQEIEKSELAEENKALEKALQAKKEEFKKLENLEALKVELDKLEEEKKDLAIQQPEIQKLKKEHERFMIAKDKIRPTWEALKTLRVQLEKNQVSLTECKRWAEGFDTEIADLEEKLSGLRKKSQDRPSREAKIRDLQKILEIQVLESKKALVYQELKIILPEIENKKASQKALFGELEKLENVQDAKSLPTLNQLAEWKALLLENSKLLSASERLNQILNSIQANLNSLEESKSKSEEEIPGAFQDLNEWKRSLKISIESKEKSQIELKEKLGLGAHVHLLEDGKPCPLCGSMEHPNPQDENQNQEELQKIENEISSEKEVLEKIEKLIQKVSEIDFQIKQLGRDLEGKTLEKEKTESRIAEIKKITKSAGFESLDKLSSELTKFKSQIEKQEKSRKEIQEKRKAVDSLRQEIEKLETQSAGSQKQMDQISGSIEGKKADFTDPDFCNENLNTPSETLQGWISKVTDDIQKTEEAFVGAQKHLEGRKKQQTVNATDIKNYERNVSEISKEKNSRSQEFESLKEKYGFINEEELEQLFEKSIEEEVVAKKIREFEDRFNFVERRISQLLESEELKEFDEDHFHNLKILIQKESETLDNHRTQLALLSKEIEKLKEDLKTKEKLESDESNLEKRESYLKELERLFQGSGFVKYVSSIYLQELCRTANLRFMKLTKNQLAIEVDSNNTFWVIDYLNGGEKRLLKSLSGGQTFQACLCLALALAEKIKALNQADQSFFFMDEGFGALDKTSLSVVFDTLKSLQYENRVVGIISHVEDLQQEIGVYAKVNLDPEIGSQISYSYNLD
ncbi:AAA family ATPase [Algoriphagus sediminis]|uniref:SMC family ATPase n=1 Tax=Algoriphagus sediminis TaxID=3057113 RepID=A0ABT7YG21_9BACT|nr:SMC family ATPase [Algoriphagus sediminis]MDN3205459.1 SMC family ATPase [Algoriphagus sediminis]